MSTAHRLYHLELAVDRIERKIKDMATWEDVKAAADKQAAVDAKVLDAVAAMKASIASLQAQIASLPAGPTADAMQTVADELNKGADSVTAAIG